jgi:hypothetical protein
MPDIPDTRVRLSAEGLAEVLSALRQIRTEGQKTATSNARSFEGFNAVLEKGVQLLELFGVTAGIAGLVELTRRGAEAASVLTDLAETTGLTTSELQSLFALAQKSGVGVEQLTRNLDTFQKQLDALASGDQAAQGIFKRLGLTPEDLRGKDLSQAIDLVAGRMNNLAASEGKTTIAGNLFGKSGARLIPVLGQIAGSGGLGAVVKAAEAAGTALDKNVIAGAARVSNELHGLQQVAGNLAITFASTLGPAIIDALTAAGTEIGNVQRGIRDQAPGLQFLVDTATVGILLIATLVDAILLGVNVLATGTARAISATMFALTGDFERAGQVFRDTFREIDKITKDFQARDDARKAQLKGLVSFGGTAQAPPAAGGGGRGTPPRDPGKDARDRIALARATADNELKLNQQINKAQQDLEKQRFEDGLTNLKDYYSRRRFLIEAAAAAEIATLTERLAAERQNPDDAQKALAIANTEAEIVRRKLQLQQDLAGSFHDEQKGRDDLTKQQLDAQSKIFDAEGRRHEQALVDINTETLAFQKLLEQTPNLTDANRLQQLNEFALRLRAAEEFQHQQELLTRALADLDRDRSAIQAQIEAGVISELNGKRQIAALDAARVGDLDRIAQLTRDAAEQTGDPDRIQRAKELQQTIHEIGVSVTETQRLMVNFGDSATDVLGQGLEGLLTGASRGFENLGDVALQSIEQIIQGLNRLAAQIIISGILALIGGVATAGASGGAGGASGAPRGAAAPKRLARGGLIHGPGSETSDSIPALLSRGEYVVRAAAVRQPGVLSILRMINEPIAPVDPMRATLRAQRFADGGLVSGGVTAKADVSGTVTIAADDSVIFKAIESPRGQKIILNGVTRRPKAYNRALGKN